MNTTGPSEHHAPPVFFKDSPDAGTPECRCSWCGLPIAAPPEERIPIRMFDDTTGMEARFHHACFEEFLHTPVEPGVNE